MQRRLNSLILAVVLALTCTALAGDKKAAAKAAAPAAPASNSAFEKVIDKVLVRETENTKALRTYTPLVETYLQYMKPDHELGTVPFGDEYFLTRISFGRTLENLTFHDSPGLFHRLTHTFSRGGDRAEFDPQGFAWMAVIDLRVLDRANYQFDYQGREFIGELRCIVIDVTPRGRKAEGRFLGRIWVEDRDYNIVRFNGTFTEAQHGQYLHLDTWRLNMRPGVWLPAYIYTEDKAPTVSRVKGASFKAVTRLWGYNVGKGHAENEYTEVLVDDQSAAVKDNSDRAQDMTPVAAQRSWLRQAEDNVIERLERGGLLARQGEVDKVLNTVVNNLEITNNLDIQPEVRCRVLLTSPLESFSVGHTIFISRGMLDVLPDEASLAAILSHELAHIALGHPTDTTFAYKDRSIVSDQKLLARMHFRRTVDEEREADNNALELLQASPYRDKLNDVGLFLRQVDARRTVLPHLVQAELGNSISSGGTDLRLKSLTNQAPALAPKQVTQIAALPLGGRVRVDPYNNEIEINKAKPVQLLTAREKMPFEITPIFPHLTRLAVGAADPQAPAAAQVPPAPTPDAGANKVIAAPTGTASAPEAR